MNIAILSDAHLFHRNAITVEKYHDILLRLQDSVDIFVDCGDLTDKSSLTAPQLDELSVLFSDIYKPVYIVAGNHDSISNTTVASILKLKPNIHIITQPTVLDHILFVPYKDNIKSLCQMLDELVDEPVDFAFSHLNITDNVYASLSFKDLKILYKYADTWFNGHIHTPEKTENTIYGRFYNVGACSSLTFGDEHNPCYSIYNTDRRELISYTIFNSLIHRTYNFTRYDIESSIGEILTLSKNFNLRCRFQLPNSSDSVELRKKIKSELEDQDRVKEVQFDYVKDPKINKIVKKNNTKINKESLMKQLISCFEKDNNIEIDDDIKKELLG